MRPLWSAAALMARVPAFLFRSRFRVHGDSMRPTLLHGDLLHIIPPCWTPAGYPRGSVVVVMSPAQDGAFWVKRVVGLPGEFVTIQGAGGVLIDDSPLPEPYLSHPYHPAEDTPPWLCDGDEYFLMGDNRSDSDDSRRYGPVSSHRIIGRVWLRWPLRRPARSQEPIQ
ncbi:MAG: signal peptidase I [Chloroflexi bacterium]|nr:signal peptidase I [Chloroflexota bacterium]